MSNPVGDGPGPGPPGSGSGGGREPIGLRRTIPVGAQPARGTSEPLPIVNLYEALGGQEFFDELVERFYRRVALDAVLRPLYPEDLTDPKRHLALFLGQYWGGPTTYSDERGHPRLRMRHAPFAVGPAERDAWLRNMTAALDSLVVERDIHPVVEARLVDYFVMAAEGMINTR